MKIRLVVLALVLMLTGAGLCLAQNGSADSAAQSRLTIRLPDEATVEGENLTLGQVAEVNGSEAIVAKAREVQLGRISLPGQKVTIDRSLILSRLACSEAAVVNPVFSGADKVIVNRKALVIKGDKFIDSASSFLAGSIREQSIARWEPAKVPAEFVLPAGTQNFDLVPRLVSRGANGLATIEVGVVADGKLAGSRQITLRPKYNVHKMVTTTDIAAGQAITAENTRIENAVSDEAQTPDWAAPYGLVAVRNLPSGSVISPGMAKPPKAQVVIERNQTVIIRIESAGLLVTALGKTMQQGKLGEYIKVRNIDSQRVIMAKVNEDGTVEPVL
jgi:flagella basal body P-ring formation protein FlgA